MRYWYGDDYRRSSLFCRTGYNEGVDGKDYGNGTGFPSPVRIDDDDGRVIVGLYRAQLAYVYSQTESKQNREKWKIDN